MNSIKLNYGRLISVKVVLFISTLSVLVISALIYLNPVNHGWWNSPEFSWFNLLQFIFLDQILIECITVFIILFLMKIYAEQLKLKEVKMTRSALVKYEFFFLPVALLAFFFFNPFTQTVRFLYNYFPHLDWSVYWEDYFYSLKLYITYLPISFLLVYGVLNYNLLSQRIKSNVLDNKELDETFIEVSTPTGKKPLNKKNIVYCEKRGRKYFIHTSSELFTTTSTISQLETNLSPNQFIRINRATIVKIDAIKSYSFWENDKYVVRTEDGHEFIMSRSRMNAIKARLNLNQSNYG